MNYIIFNIKALKYLGRMEFLISASQALNSIYLRLKTDFKLIQEFNTKNLKNCIKYLKVSYWKKTGHVDTLSRT